jgi:serine/threonine protein kinase
MRTLAEQGIAAVPPVIENGRDERGRPFFVMPWYSEGSLENLIERGGLRQQYIAGVTMLLAVVDGLASVHDAGWAHRDLKPANILLEKQSAAS